MEEDIVSQDLQERLQEMELRSATAARVEEQLRTSLDVAATELLRTKREQERVICESAHPGVVEAFKPEQFCGTEVLTVDQWELRHLIDCARATGQSFASSRAAWFYINLLEGAAELLWRGCARAFFHEQESYFYRDEFFCGLQGEHQSASQEHAARETSRRMLQLTSVVTEHVTSFRPQRHHLLVVGEPKFARGFRPRSPLRSASTPT